MAKSMLPYLFPCVAEPTAEGVEKRIREAIQVSVLMPDKDERFRRPLRATWPTMTADMWVEPEPAREVRERPDIASISRLDECISWLWSIGDQRTRSIVMARCSGARWQKIADKAGLSRRWCRMLFNQGIDTITSALINGHHKI